MVDENKSVCSPSAFACYGILNTYAFLSGRQQQQQPSHAGPVVPAFGAPLPKAPQLPPRPKSTLAPTLSGPVQSSKERTLEDIEAEEDRLEQEEERLRARRRELMEERRQLTQR